LNELQKIIDDLRKDKCCGICLFYTGIYCSRQLKTDLRTVHNPKDICKRFKNMFGKEKKK